MNKRFQRTAARIAAAVGVGVSSIVLAGASFQGGTITLLHTPDLNNPSQGDFALSGTPRAAGSAPAPPRYTLNRNYVVGSNTLSTAKGTVGQVTNVTTATAIITAGTGVSQFDPLNQLSGASALRIDLNDLLWTATSPSFGPPATGYFSFTTAGRNGSGGSSRVRGQIEFRNAVTNALLRPMYSFDQTFASSGTFSQTFTSSALLGSGSLAAGTSFKLNGFIEFRTQSATSSFADFGADASEVLLDEFEVGYAGPTWTYVGLPNQIGQPAPDWFAASSWRPDANNIDPAVIPNGPGHRARFAFRRETIPGATDSVIIPQDLTLGQLDIVSETTAFFSVGSSSFVPGNPPTRLRFDSGDPLLPASITLETPTIIRDSVLSANTQTGTVELVSPLSIRVGAPDDSPGPALILLGGNRLGTGRDFVGGANTYIQKTGPGRLIVDANLGVPQLSISQGHTEIRALQNSGSSATLSLSAVGTGSVDFTRLRALNNRRTTYLRDLELRDEAVVMARGFSNSPAPGIILRADRLLMDSAVTTQAELQLGDMTLIVDYTGATPFADLSSLVQRGRNSGTWNGKGINGRRMTLPDFGGEAASRVVGIAEAFDLFGPGVHLYRGESVDDSAIIARGTVMGDANLDGTTNIGDFARLAANFNLTGVWSRGDFNYDGTTDIADFSLLAANFNFSLPGNLQRTSIPEPTTLMLMASSAVLLRRRVSSPSTATHRATIPSP